MTDKPTRGGKREGSGRKPTGKKVVTSSINLLPEEWAKMDAIRGKLSRSAWVALKVKKARA